MRFKRYFLLVLTFVMFGCNQNSQLNYPEEKLINVTKDLYVASEAIRRLDEHRKDSLRELYHDQIETIHNIEMQLYEDDIKSLKGDHQNYLRFHKLVRDTIQTINDSIKGEKKYKDSKKKK